MAIEKDRDSISLTTITTKARFPDGRNGRKTDRVTIFLNGHAVYNNLYL